MLKSLLILAVLFTVHITAMFEDQFMALNNAIDSVSRIPNTHSNGYREINDAVDNSGSYEQVMDGGYATGNVMYSGPAGEHFKKSASYGSVSNARPFVTLGGPVVGNKAPICLTPIQISEQFNLKENSYGYPKSDIHYELTNRPQVRAAILGLRPGQVVQYPIKPHVRSVSKAAAVLPVSTGIDGCRARKLNLRRFYAYGGQCWVINPAYQNINYVRCKFGCSYNAGDGGKSYCAENHVKTYVWAYCEGLGYGARIQAVLVPLPMSCSCKSYRCN